MLIKTPDKLHFVEQFYSFDCIDSTNDHAKTIHPIPLKGMYVVQATVQNQGRGRHGRSFFSNVFGGLWISIITPVEDITNHFTYNRALSVAICSTLLELYPDSDIKIKWPNDIYWNGKKVAGILLESLPASEKHLILGFGLNVNIPISNFPSELAHLITSVQNETSRETPLVPLLEAILIQFYNFCKNDHLTEYLYTSLLYKTGSLVRINNINGTFNGVRKDGQIELSTDKGIVYFNSGTLEYLQV